MFSGFDWSRDGRFLVYVAEVFSVIFCVNALNIPKAKESSNGRIFQPLRRLQVHLMLAVARDKDLREGESDRQPMAGEAFRRWDNYGEGMAEFRSPVLVVMEPATGRVAVVRV